MTHPEQLHVLLEVPVDLAADDPRRNDARQAVWPVLCSDTQQNEVESGIVRLVDGSVQFAS
jgi:hypothetical protein